MGLTLGASLVVAVIMPGAGWGVGGLLLALAGRSWDAKYRMFPPNEDLLSPRLEEAPIEKHPPVPPHRDPELKRDKLGVFGCSRGARVPRSPEGKSMQYLPSVPIPALHPEGTRQPPPSRARLTLPTT